MRVDPCPSYVSQRSFASMWCRRALACLTVVLGALESGPSFATTKICFVVPLDSELQVRTYQIAPESWWQWHGEEPIPIGGSVTLKEIFDCFDDDWSAAIRSLRIVGTELDVAIPSDPVLLGGVWWSDHGGMYRSWVPGSGGWLDWGHFEEGLYAEFEISAEPPGGTEGRVRRTWLQNTLDGNVSLVWDGSMLPASFDLDLSVWTSSSLCRSEGYPRCELEGEPQEIGAMRLVATVPEARSGGLAAAAFAATGMLGVLRRGGAPKRSRDHIRSPLQRNHL